MIENFNMSMRNLDGNNILQYLQGIIHNPIDLLLAIIDVIIVVFLIYKFVKIVRGSRAWQLLKGIVLLIVVAVLSSWLHLYILNYILTSIMTYGVLVLIVIFQPELRRALEQLGSNKFTKFFGIDQDIATKTKEDIYKTVIAITELATTKTGALIVMERDIQIKDIIATGIALDSEVSPQLLVNIFTPKTPLHDGAVVISGNKIAAAACMLPLASDTDIARDLGTRHRAAIGISKESDAIAIVVSEETGKISVAKDGTLIADLREDALKKILINHIVTKRFIEKKPDTLQKIKKLKIFHSKDLTNKDK